MVEPTARRKALILAICCLSLLIVGMDATIVNVALPAIRAELHSGVSGLQWVIDAYTLTLASLLLLSGSTADRIGRRRTFQIGLVSFTAGSLLCSLAPTLQLLIIARIIQAVGGSMLNPVAMSIITNVFREPRERAKAIGIWGGVVGISMGLGPVLGGILIQTVGWRWIFWINVPIGVAAIVLAGIFVPESKAPTARRLAPLGQILVIAVLGGSTYAIVESGRLGLASVLLWSIIVAAVVALAAFLAHERRRIEPLLDL
ncbi:MAG: MFS transporter, partial [Actinomycetota bacterium]|nr:MFS transporter [Actinomycetota bacterium]